MPTPQLAAALARLAPGGLLVYSVCSWLPEEGFHLRDALLARDDRVEPCPVWLPGPASVFSPDPLAWDGEGFQAFALTRR